MSTSGATSARWKGKARALDYDYDYDDNYAFDQAQRERAGGGGGTGRRWIPRGRGTGGGRARRDEGDGNADGIVLPLDMVGSGVYDVAYTLPVKFGSKNQQFSLQIDTGSSDLWVASTSCSTSSCKLTDGRLYDPSDSRSTGVDFTIPYLQGSASGPVVWDQVTIGGYTIDNQALAAASDVDSEPLTPKFSGILGLALPLNSIIAASIPPVTSNAPDGAAWASNLFSITPTSQAPSARFLSLSLARPGSDRVPSQLGIGRHPSALVPDPSKIAYSTLVSEASGTLFWKVGVRAITVYVDGQRKDVDVGQSSTGAVFPSAVVDSGVPLILTTSAIANAVYGAIGVEPASDGKYYVPCTTPLNLTFTLDTRPEIPIHPLDLTAEPPDTNQASFCIGLIQTADSVLASSSTNNAIGDMILGVPFLRNVYSVMAYTAPEKDGSFPAGPGGGDVKPRLGLLALTDPAVALQEFHTVRVLNQPLSSSPSAGPSAGSSAGSSGTGSDNNTKTVSAARALSHGAIAGLVILGLAVLIAGTAATRWILSRRAASRRRKAEREREIAALGMAGAGAWDVDLKGMGMGMTMDQKAAYAAVRGKGLDLSFLDTDVMGAAKGKGGVGEDGMLLRERESDRTLLGGRGSQEKGSKGAKHADEDEFGVHKTVGWEGEGDDTLVGGALGGGGGPKHAHDTHMIPRTHPESPPSSPEMASSPLVRHQHHQYADSDSDSNGPGVRSGGEHLHKQMGSVEVPLLARGRGRADSDADADVDGEVEAEGDGNGDVMRARGRNYSLPSRAPGGGGVGASDPQS